MVKAILKANKPQESVYCFTTHCILGMLVTLLVTGCVGGRGVHTKQLCETSGVTYNLPQFQHDLETVSVPQDCYDNRMSPGSSHHSSGWWECCDGHTEEGLEGYIGLPRRQGEGLEVGDSPGWNGRWHRMSAGCPAPTGLSKEPGRPMGSRLPPCWRGNGSSFPLMQLGLLAGGGWPSRSALSSMFPSAVHSHCGTSIQYSERAPALASAMCQHHGDRPTPFPGSIEIQRLSAAK